jgi:hypothetical protein
VGVPRWAGSLAVCVAVVAVPLRGEAAPGLVLTGEARLGGPGTLELVATNLGPEPLAGVAPEVVFAHRTESGDAVALAPGERRSWTFTLAPPEGVGMFPVTVRAGYRDGEGRAGSAVLVLAVGTPDARAGPVEARLLLGRVVGSSGAQLVLSSQAAVPIAGRAALVTAGGLQPQPETQPAEVPAHGETRVPFVIEDIGAELDEPQPVFGLLEYELDGVHHAALARAEATVLPGARARRSRPLLVGLGALAVAFLLLAVAWHTARRRTSGRGNPPARPPSHPQGRLPTA